MFKSTYLALVMLCFFFSVNAQNFTDEIPNYFLAKNSNFTVTLITSPPFGTTTSNSASGFSGVIPHTKLKKLDADQFDNINEGMYNQVFGLMQDRFKKLGISPSFFIVIPMSDFADPNKMKELAQKTKDAKPGFSLYITIPNTLPKAEKAYRKGGLTLEHIKPASISIMKTYANPEEAKGKPMYALNKMNMSLEKGFGIIEKNVSDKGQDYFVETMDIPMEAFDKEVDVSYLEKYENVNEELASYPAEDELSNATLLVISLGTEEGDKTYNYHKKLMDKYYPHKYKLVAMVDYAKHINNHKYVLLAKGDLYEKKKVSEGNNGFNKVKTSITSRNYYFIKDVEALKCYYGMEKEEILKKATDSPYSVLENTLKWMKKNYNWEK